MITHVLQLRSFIAADPNIAFLIRPSTRCLPLENHSIVTNVSRIIKRTYCDVSIVIIHVNVIQYDWRDAVELCQVQGLPLFLCGVDESTLAQLFP